MGAEEERGRLEGEPRREFPGLCPFGCLQGHGERKGGWHWGWTKAWSLAVAAALSPVTSRALSADEEHSDNHIRVVGNIQTIRLGLLWELEGLCVCWE